MKSLNAFRSERFVFTVQTGSVKRKVFQVLFGERDGSFYVNFPYCRGSRGLVSIGTLPPNIIGPVQIDLEKQGKVTSEFVKYAHHPDGRVHFSQTGRVRTSILRNTLPLSTTEGHVFTIMIEGMLDFELAKLGKDDGAPTSTRTVLNVELSETKATAFKFLGWWYHAGQLLRRMHGASTQGPKVMVQKGLAQFIPAFVITGTDSEYSSKYALLVSCEEIPSFSNAQRPNLTFVGGFGPTNVKDPADTSLSFLAMTFPVANYEELRHRVGSIDLRPADFLLSS